MDTIAPCPTVTAATARRPHLPPILVAVLALALVPATAPAQVPPPPAVHCQGAGPPVYLVGGGPAFTTWHLAPVQQSLADAYRVCRWDMRGVGDNALLPVPDGDSLLEAWLADMAAVLPPGPVVLWGHSWGALQALLFASRHPGRVAGLVLSNPVDPALESLEHVEDRRYVHHLPEAYPDLADMGTERERLLALRRKIASYLPDGELGWAYAGQFDGKDADAALNVRVWEEYRATPLDRAALESVAPLVGGIIYCRGDVLMPASQQAYTRLYPRTNHLTLEDCGHFPWVERPTDYRATLRQLMEQTTAGATARLRAGHAPPGAR